MPFLPLTLPGIFHGYESAPAQCEVKADAAVHPFCLLWHLLPHSRYSDNQSTGQADTFMRRARHHDAAINIEMAKELTLALIQTRSIPPDSMQETLQQAYTLLTTLKVQEETGPTTALPAGPPPTVNWRKSITKYAITCLECGHAFKQLTIRHLRTHDLDARSYRTKYGMPQSQPLAARETIVRRRQVVQETRPWEKAPAYRKRHAGEHPQSTAPEAEAVQDETEAARAAAAPPAQPKRQRKTTPKKPPARPDQKGNGCAKAMILRRW